MVVALDMNHFLMETNVIQLPNFSQDFVFTTM